jgi:hypothetical protein
MDLDKKSAENTFPAEFHADSVFLRNFESAGNFPAEFSAENKIKSTENFAANNPQVIPQKYLQENSHETFFRR